MQETPVQFLGWEDSLEKGIHSSILAWRDCIVHGVTKGRTWLSDFDFDFWFSNTETYWEINSNSISTFWVFPICCCGSVAKSCPILFSAVDCILPGSSVHRILQARILKWVTMPSSRGSSQCRDQTHVSCIAGGFFTTREAPSTYLD